MPSGYNGLENTLIENQNNFLFIARSKQIYGKNLIYRNVFRFNVGWNTAKLSKEN